MSRAPAGSIAVHRDADRLRIDMVGEIDAAVVTDHQRAAILAGPTATTTIDMSRVTFAGSAAINLIVLARTVTSAPPTLLGASPRFRQLLAALNLDNLVDH